MKIPYGKTFIDIDLPRTLKWHVLEKDVPFAFASEKELVYSGIEELLRQLEGRISSKSRLLIIIPDHTRKCNLPLILPLLIKALQTRFMAKIELLVANGSHAQQPERVIRELVSESVAKAVPISQHNAKDRNQLVHAGTSSNGNEFWLNKKVLETDFIITVGGILYHYFAGFGGGPKMICPGVAGYETIRRNHALTIDRETKQMHAQSRDGEIQQNPVYQDLAQVLKFIPNTLSLQVVLSPDKKIAACRAGDIISTQKALLPTVQQIYGLPIREKYDTVIAGAGGFPADVNLIQSHKALRHACDVLKQGGTLFFFAHCGEGIGSQTFLAGLRATAGEMGENLANNFVINGQTALSLKERTERFNIIFVSDLDATLVGRLGMTPCTAEQAPRLLKQHTEKGHTGAVIAKADSLVPIS